MTEHGNIYGIAAQRAAERRQNLAQGGASAASGTLGVGPNKITAGFSGRQSVLFRPLKRAHKLSRRQYPGLRFACPGLHSAVRFADSLNRTGPRSIGLAAVLILLLLFTGCSHRGGGISSRAGGWPPSSSPTEISSSAQVVKVTTLPAQIAAGGSTDAIVRLSIMPGYHINANPATFPYLIATEITPGKADGITMDKPTYPAAEKRRFQFAEEPLAVYEGEAEIKLPLRVEAKATASARSVPINIRVQACDNEKCFPPATLNATIQVEVK